MSLQHLQATRLCSQRGLRREETGYWPQIISILSRKNFKKQRFLPDPLLVCFCDWQLSFHVWQYGVGFIFFEGGGSGVCVCVYCFSPVKTPRYPGSSLSSLEQFLGAMWEAVSQAVSSERSPNETQLATVRFCCVFFFLFSGKHLFRDHHLEWCSAFSMPRTPLITSCHTPSPGSERVNPPDLAD